MEVKKEYHVTYEEDENGKDATMFIGDSIIGLRVKEVKEVAE